MISQQSFPSICLLTAVALACAVLASGAASTSPNEDQVAQPAASVPSARARFEPAKLFDFDNYKQIFKKTYSSLLEEVARRKYFLSRAFRTFISAIKYKYRQASYYLALNWMSDLSRNELDKMRNKVLERRSAQPGGRVPPPPPPPNEVPEEELLDVAKLLSSNDEQVQHELDGLLEESQRRSRVSGDGPRELPLERLIESGSGSAKVGASLASKIKLDVASNNPNYAGPNDYVCSRAGNQTRVEFLAMQLKASVVAARSSLYQSDWKAQQSDEVFLDLRDTTKCFFMPRDQGLCGCCYAFTTITLIEWLYCMKTGNLVAFSEQYMIDCGNDFMPELDGCDGGDIFSVADFVNHFGLELRARYPFLMRNDKCPYQADTNLATTGYIRFEFDRSASIHVNAFELALRNGPIALTISLADGFQEYGGGVHGYGCDQKDPSHAVVLIGHGREDGEEYWLIRNSFSVGWGEGGHYKLAKAANCIHPNYGNQYATRENFMADPKIEHNSLYDEAIIKRHYAKNLIFSQPKEF